MIPERDPDLTTYLSKLFRTEKPEQQNFTFWFSITKNPGNTEHHAPIQTQTLKELPNLKEKEKLNPAAIVESHMKFLERFVWADTLPTETEKQTAAEDFPVE